MGADRRFKKASCVRRSSSRTLTAHGFRYFCEPALLLAARTEVRFRSLAASTRSNRRSIRAMPVVNSTCVFLTARNARSVDTPRVSLSSMCSCLCVFYVRAKSAALLSYPATFGDGMTESSPPRTGSVCAAAQIQMIKRTVTLIKIEQAALLLYLASTISLKNVYLALELGF